MYGGSLTISLGETGQSSMLDDLLREVASGSMVPNERILALSLSAQWEVGEAGAGGALKAGDRVDVSHIHLDPANLSLENLLNPVIQFHASHLLRLQVASLNSTRIALFPLNPPSLVSLPAEPIGGEGELSYRIPLPSKHKPVALRITISRYTGLLEISDDAGTEARALRARMATSSVNEGKSRLQDDLVRLIQAVRCLQPLPTGQELTYGRSSWRTWKIKCVS